MEKMIKFLKNHRVLIFSAFAIFPLVSLASEGGHEGSFAASLFWIVLIMIAAKISSLIEKFGQPAVLGELLIGVIIGNLSLLGWHFFEGLGHDSAVAFLAELGVVILLFQIGLESNISTMKSVGWKAFMVASIGVVVPFVLGTYLAGPLLMPGQDFNTYLFLGATLTATSVGITARVFKDLKKLQTPEAQIVLGAAVIDDVMGLVILAVVSALVTAGGVSLGGVAAIVGKAVGFLAAAIIAGQLAAPYLGKFFSKINSGSGMKLVLALSFGLFVAYLASLIGLAPIVGAFAAGLVLDSVHFKEFQEAKIIEELRQEEGLELSDKQKKSFHEHLDHHAKHHIEELIEPLGFFLVPIFFVMTGYGVKLDTLNNLPIILLSLGLTVAAFIGKIVAGLAAGKADKLIVGVGMIPRGEVGLIFAMMGRSLGVISDQFFSAIVIMVIVSTLATPPLLSFLIKRQDRK
jgi:Kef-type K+ transport system membrane component KefB